MNTASQDENFLASCDSVVMLELDRVHREPRPFTLPFSRARKSSCDASPGVVAEVGRGVLRLSLGSPDHPVNLQPPGFRSTSWRRRISPILPPPAAWW